jgi:hypothetical protein
MGCQCIYVWKCNKKLKSREALAKLFVSRIHADREIKNGENYD